MQIKGQEYPMHEPRFKHALAISYALSPTGADHCHALHDAELGNTTEDGMLAAADLRSMGVLDPLPVSDLSPAKVRATIYKTVFSAMGNCACLCSFVPWSLRQSTELICAATGWNMSDYELMKVGERALTLARVFNTREGFVSKDDHIAERTHGPTTSGALAKGGINRRLLKKAIKTYYAMIGWNRYGMPAAAKLQELDIAWAATYI